MLRPRIQHYDEKKPYIFISYAHKDSDVIDPILKQLQADGFRIWYDQGIKTSSDWVQTLGEKLKKSMFVLAFISNNYLKSKNCKNELLKACRDKNTSNCILIYIEDAKMDEGLDLYFASQQHISWYAQDHELLCYDLLYKTEGLGKCNINGKVPQLDLSSVYDQEMPEPSPVAPAATKKIIPASRTELPVKKMVAIAACIIAALILFSLALKLIRPNKQTDSNEPGYSDVDSLAENGYDAEIGDAQTGDSDVGDSADADYNADNAPDAADDSSDAGDDVSSKTHGASIPSVTSNSGDKKELISIESPVESKGFGIWENVANTLSTVYPKAVVIGDWENAYVRYSTVGYSRFIGTYSVVNQYTDIDEYTLRIYLDDQKDAPYTELVISRSTVETPLDIDVSGAQFITFEVEGLDSKYCSLLLSDCYLTNGDINSPAEAKSSGIPPVNSKSDDKKELVSIESPVESKGFAIWENVANTLSTVYPKAAVIGDWENAYVRYYVGDCSRFTGAYSVANEYTDIDEYTMRIYLDDQKDAPYTELVISRSTVETPLDIDVSGAQFITFEVEGLETKYCSLLLSDCYLIK